MDVLNRKILILNADFRVLRICGVYKAFLLVYLNKAEIVSKANGFALCTVNKAYEIPSIIRLKKYATIPYKGVMLTRQNIFKRDSYKCVYCGSPKDLTLDHVVPRSKGGKFSWSNLVVACKRCNSKKGNSLPDEAQMPLPYKPYKPSFIIFLKEFSRLGDDSWKPYLKTA